jgi:hypothetical protein
MYGSPLVNFLLLGSITYFGLHLLQQRLAYDEYQKRAEDETAQLEQEVNALQHRKGVVSRNFIK